MSCWSKAQWEDPIKRASLKRKMSEAHKGLEFSAEHKDNLSVALKGKKKSQEHCESFKKAYAEGRRVYVQPSLKARKRRSKRLRALWRSGVYKNTLKRNKSEAGRERSRQLVNRKKFRDASSVAVKNNWKDFEYRRKMIDTVRESRSRQVFPFKDTKPERLVQDWLDSKGVFYVPHVICRWMQTRHQWDLYLPRDKLLIEVNGCYWHGCSACFPDKKIGRFDSVISQYKMVARQRGWDVLVLWEHDIKSGFAFNLLGSFIDGYKVAA